MSPRGTSKQAPTHFAYHDYLRKVLNTEPASPLNILTEKEFRQVPPITYPYRSYFYAVGLLHSGRCRIQIGPAEYVMKQRSLTLVGPGISRMWLENDWSAANTTLFFTPEVFQKPFYNNLLLDFQFFQPAARHVINLQSGVYEELVEMINLVKRYDSIKMRAACLFLLLQRIDAIYHEQTDDRESRRAAAAGVVQEFYKVIQENFHHQKEVAFYADCLHISPKKLSAIIKQETGKTAKQQIDDFVLFEAKSLLRQTAMSIKEIVYWLGLEDPSYFNRMFKAREHCTPLEYRTHRQ